MFPVSLERAWKCNGWGVGADFLHILMERTMSPSPKYNCFIRIFKKEKEHCQAGGGVIVISDGDPRKLSILASNWKGKSVS